MPSCARCRQGDVATAWRGPRFERGHLWSVADHAGRAQAATAPAGCYPEAARRYLRGLCRFAKMSRGPSLYEMEGPRSVTPHAIPISRPALLGATFHRAGSASQDCRFPGPSHASEFPPECRPFSATGKVLLAPQPAHKTLLAMNIGESPLPMGHPQKLDGYPL